MKKGNSNPKPATNPQKPVNNPVKPSSNPIKPVTSTKPKMGLGFGFGDAMFAMKNLTADYEHIGSIPSQPVPSQVNKNPLSSLKPAPLLKPTNPVPAQQKTTLFNQAS